MKNKLLLTILLTFLHYFSFGQVLTQTVRGTVVDMISQAPLPGATVVVLGVEPIIGTAADIDGNFRLNKVPVGTRSLKISFLGYKERVLPNITVTSGKEVVLQVTLEENVVQGKKSPSSLRWKRQTAERIQHCQCQNILRRRDPKYAAAVNDPPECRWPMPVWWQRTTATTTSRSAAIPRTDCYGVWRVWRFRIQTTSAMSELQEEESPS